MRTNLKIYKMSCPGCGWSERFTVRADNLAVFIVNLLTGYNRLPSKCPKCGGRLDKINETLFWKT